MPTKKSIKHKKGSLYKTKNKIHYSPITSNLDQRYWQEIIAYSKIDLPVLQSSPLATHFEVTNKDIKYIKKKDIELDGKRQDTETNNLFLVSDNGWDVASLYLMSKVALCHNKMKQFIPQYKIDGTRNVWIVKPCYNARGFGIYCTDDCL